MELRKKSTLPALQALGRSRALNVSGPPTYLVRAVQDTGVPLPGVKITLVRDHRSLTPLAEGVTNDQGIFEYKNIDKIQDFLVYSADTPFVHRSWKYNSPILNHPQKKYPT